MRIPELVYVHAARKWAFPDLIVIENLTVTQRWVKYTSAAHYLDLSTEKFWDIILQQCSRQSSLQSLFYSD